MFMIHLVQGHKVRSIETIFNTVCLWTTSNLLYINDITSSLKNCKVSFYADDTALYITHNDIQVASRSLQQDLKSGKGNSKAYSSCYRYGMTYLYFKFYIFWPKHSGAA